MKFHVLNRKVHYWLSVVVAGPLLVVIGTGILLQLKKQVPWVQPPEQRGPGQTPALAFGDLLAICRDVPEAEVQGWEDIQRLDVRPSKGMMKVWAKNGWEVQIDIQTGQVLQVAYRRSDLIESIHDGSWFHDAIKYWLFLPAAVVLLVMLLTGLYLFALPYLVRGRRKRPLDTLGPSSAQ